MSTAPKEASIPPEYSDISDESSNFSSGGECSGIRENQGIDSFQETNFSTNTAPDTEDNVVGSYVETETEDSPEDIAAKALVSEYMDRYANVYSRDPSQEKNSTNTASETQDNAANPDVVTKTEDSPEDVAAKALEEEYMNKYASVYSKELLFAIDVMTLVRYLNRLELKYIMYATSGDMPTSPCDDTLDQALWKMWEEVVKVHGDTIEAAMNTRMDYQYFQRMILQIARLEEKGVWVGEKTFLSYCLVIAQSAVCAERNGLTVASDFIPLVICRTIQNRKDSGRFPVDFWERVANLAQDVISATEGQ